MMDASSNTTKEFANPKGPKTLRERLAHSIRQKLHYRLMLVSNMIGQAPSDTYDLPVNRDCNGNTWKGQPRALRQDQLNPMNMCPELSKLPSVPQKCSLDPPTEMTAEAQQPVMPSVVAGSVEGNVGQMEVGGTGNIQKEDQTNQPDDRISRRKSRPVRDRGINYLYGVLESMKQVEPSPQEGDTTVSSSPGDLSMICEDDELAVTQLLGDQEHLEATRKYWQEMDTYLLDLEKYFIQKHGLDRRKAESSPEGTNSGPEEITVISRGTQASPTEATNQDVVIGPAIEMDLSKEDEPKESGESCYTRELEALTNSLPSTSPLKIPTTRTKMHLTQSTPKNRFCRPSSEDNATTRRDSAALSEPASSNDGHQRPSASPGDGMVNGVGMSRSPDYNIGGTARDYVGGASKKRNTNKDSNASNRTDLCPNTRENLVNSRKDTPKAYVSKPRTPETHKHPQANKNSHLPQPTTSAARVSTSHHVVPSNRYPFADVDNMVNMSQQVPQSSRDPTANVGGTLNTNCHVTPSNRNRPNPSCQVTQSERYAGTDRTGSSGRVYDGPQSQDYGTDTLASLLASPLSPQVNPQGLVGQHHVPNSSRFATPSHPRGTAQEGHRMQPPSGIPPSSHPSSTQRVPGYYGYGMFHPHYNQYGHNPWMNGYQSAAHASKPPSASRGPHPTRETPPSGEGSQGPPKRRRSSSGNRASKRHPSGDQPHPQGKEGGDSNTYHYRPENPLSSHFEKSYQEIVNRGSSIACPNVNVRHAWQPTVPGSNVPPPTQQLPSSYFGGPWPYGQQVPIPNMAVYPPASYNNNLYVGHGSGSSRPSFHPTGRHPERPTQPLPTHPSPAHPLPTHQLSAHPLPTHPPPAYRSKGNSQQSHSGQHNQPQQHPTQQPQQHPTQQPQQHPTQQRPQRPTQQLQQHPTQQPLYPNQQTGTHSSPPGNMAQPGRHMSPTEYAMNAYVQMSMMNQPLLENLSGQQLPHLRSNESAPLSQTHHENLIGQRASLPRSNQMASLPQTQHGNLSGQRASLPRSNQMDPLQQVQQQNRNTGQQQASASGVRQPDLQQQHSTQQPMYPRQQSGTRSSSTDHITSNIQNAMGEILSSNRTMSPPELSNPVFPGILAPNDPGIPASSKQQVVPPGDAAMDLSQQPVMPQITQIRSHGEPLESPHGSSIIREGMPQEPVMPKIVMVQTEKPGLSGVDPMRFSKSLERIASSMSRPPLYSSQSAPGAAFTSGREGTPVLPGLTSLAEHPRTQMTTMRLQDHVTAVIRDGILNVPDLRVNREGHSPIMDSLPQREPSRPNQPTSHKSKDKKKKKEKNKSKHKKRKLSGEQVIPSSNEKAIQNPVDVDVQPVLPAHFLKIPDVTKALTISNTLRDTSGNTLHEKDSNSLPPNVPSGPQNSLEATQEWVNKQFTSTFHRMRQTAPESSEGLCPLPDMDSCSTPVLSSLLAQPIISYQRPSVQAQQEQPSSVALVNPSSTLASMAQSHPAPGSSPAVAITGSGDDQFLHLVDEGTNPTGGVVNTANSSTSMGPEGTEKAKEVISCTDDIPIESIDSLVDMWEGLDQTGGGGIIADAASAAGITDEEEEEEIVISIPFSEEGPSTKEGEQSKATDERTPDEEGNIFDQMRTFVIDLESSPRKEDSGGQKKSDLGSIASTLARFADHHQKRDEEKSTSTTSPPGASSRPKNCTLRLVPRKRKDEHPGDNNIYRKVLSVSTLSGTDWKPGSSQQKLDNKHGSSHGKDNESKQDSTHQNSGGQIRNKSWHSLSPKAQSRHRSSHKSSRMSHRRHSSRSEDKHSSSHGRKGHKHSSHERGRHSHSSRKSGSSHHAAEKKQSRVTLAEVSANDTRSMESGHKDSGKADRYYGYKKGILPQHQHNTRFRIVCCHCEAMMLDNVAYMEHVEAVIEKSIPASKIKQLCKVCHKAQTKDLQKHIKRAHLDGGKFICKICNLNFQERKDLKFHMKEIHKALTMPYVCKICLFRTSFHSDLKQHFVDKHRGTKALLCLFCTKILYSSRSFLSHFTKHFARDSGVSCSDCVLLFLNNTSYKEHLASDHKQLGWMDKDGFPLHYELPDVLALSLDAAEKKSNQLSRKTDSPSRRGWKCLECGGSYIHLEEHLIAEYRCQNCSYFTNCSSAYTQHVVSFHSSFQDTPHLHPVEKLAVFGGQLLRCKKCGYKTSYATNMAKHVVCCPEGVSVVESFDYLKHRALKELALRERFDGRDRSVPETVITVDTDAME